MESHTLEQYAKSVRNGAIRMILLSAHLDRVIEDCNPEGWTDDVPDSREDVDDE
jgi:hypothetical protein